MSFRPALCRPSLPKSVLILCISLIPVHLSYSQPKNDLGVQIRNFGQTNEKYYRGGQPSAREFALLQQMGVKTVIDLQKDGKAEEESWVRNAGMNYVKIPLSSTRPATAEQTEYFLKLVNDPANWPVYVHCAGGRHRTGEMTAIYRITHDSWPADKAFEEMNEYGYYAFPNHGSLKNYVYSYYRNYQEEVKKQPKIVSTPPPAVKPVPISLQAN